MINLLFQPYLGVYDETYHIWLCYQEAPISAGPWPPWTHVAARAVEGMVLVGLAHIIHSEMTNKGKYTDKCFVLKQQLC